VLASVQDRSTVLTKHTIALEIILDAPEELLGDVGHVESPLGHLETVLVSVHDSCTILRETYHRLRNHFGHTGWYS
jgi:hypothetical protein